MVSTAKVEDLTVRLFCCNAGKVLLSPGSCLYCPTDDCGNMAKSGNARVGIVRRDLTKLSGPSKANRIHAPIFIQRFSARYLPAPSQIAKSFAGISLPKVFTPRWIASKKLKAISRSPAKSTLLGSC
jgi:hypothetical protein